MASSRSSTPTRIVSSGTYPIIIAQYHQEHTCHSDHWGVCVIESSYCIHTFDIRGNKDSYTYAYGCIQNLGRADIYRGGCHVGNIPRDKVEEMKLKLGEVHISKQEPRWNPQVWVMDAIKVLKEEEWAFNGLNEAFTRGELQKDLLRWEEGEDSVYERLIQEMTTGQPVLPVSVALPTEEAAIFNIFSAPKNKSTVNT
ncbi:hypothetical protein P691DRAFT_757873 [Macrolepiota fuliginosa MF-IS2]|uniref:Uncharacterized protein n=1 Tax=Macrolepiota fuliginosa MF-IS2 TaxID=1400762 RepID=A0A9P5XJQ4_9AGAR|nr:hypothetical protein P691DRAFT_757873 [Macrolepiota fuliginosa MF-IS2]